MDTDAVLNQVLNVIHPVIEPLGVELIEQELIPASGRWVLRLYIDRIAGGAVSIDDCATVSRSIAAPLEVADVIPHSYVLEVSSPGIERPLRRPKDFERFAGSRVTIKTKYEFEGRKNFTGLLKGLRPAGLQEEAILVETEEKEWLLPLTAVVKARIKPQTQGGQ